MSMIEVEGKTVDEAIQKACEQLGLSSDELEVEVLSDGSNKIFGIIGGAKVRIKATVKERPSAPDAQKAQEVLENILQRFGFETSIEVFEDNDCVTLNIKGDGSGILIGRKGQTLDALQYVVNKIVHRSPHVTKQIIVDTEGYREKRKETLIDLAKQLSERAKTREGPVTTSPLNPFERRIIHLAIQDDDELTTQSTGEGIYRSVVISPKKT
jgi:spoIIIJ-associated protein